MKNNIQTLHADQRRCGSTSTTFKVADHWEILCLNLRREPQIHVCHNDGLRRKLLEQKGPRTTTLHLPLRASGAGSVRTPRPFGLRCVGAATLGGCGGTSGQQGEPPPRGRAPLGFGGGCHSPEAPATCRRSQPSTSVRATAGSGQGTRGQVGISMSASWRRGREDSVAPRRLGRWRWRRGWAACESGKGCGEPRVWGSPRRDAL